MGRIRKQILGSFILELCMDQHGTVWNDVTNYPQHKSAKSGLGMGDGRKIFSFTLGLGWISF
jgi:hypothetical protein